MCRDKSKHGRKSGRLNKINGTVPNAAEQGSPYALLFSSETIEPYTESEIAAILDRYKPGQLFSVNPFRLRTMHHGISDKFSDGRTIADTVAQLKKNPAALKGLPSIKIAAVEIPRPKAERTDGGSSRMTALFTEDHRRVVAHRLAGVLKITAQLKSDPSVVGNYTTRNAGMSVEVRGYYDAAEGTHQRSNRSTFPRSGLVYKHAEVVFTCPGADCEEEFTVGSEFSGKNIRCSCGLSSVVP